MTQFAAKSFMVAMGGKSTMCLEKGHSGADSRGRCYCCGEQIRDVPRETSDALRNEQALLTRYELLRDAGVEPFDNTREHYNPNVPGTVLYMGPLP